MKLILWFQKPRGKFQEKQDKRKLRHHSVWVGEIEGRFKVLVLHVANPILIPVVQMVLPSTARNDLCAESRVYPEHCCLCPQNITLTPTPPNKKRKTSQ